ncbi:hypothetical protein [Spirilliplanes yamanashiensis]|uniref:DUF4190 domain-containing protein n=1 Tax=Spirilliplanes yamanashiensis TaxID=42233 RepID=A0A8J4DJR0_9ACTN|nr:hypothetical protein [Spirilliplanes yamanashiensis]MDP9815851.1 hypothetical protein [Spirilliplanes yamanashiensis]GIJ04106.1 hypothetical protein Sya03_34580 [Spirilliplanes yamanashiensis]
MTEQPEARPLSADPAPAPEGYHSPPGPYSVDPAGPPAVPPVQPAPARPPAADERWRPRSVSAVPGTPFGLVELEVPPVTSGYAIGGLVAGIGGVLASTLVLCFGVAGASDGWGLIAAGAFALLAGAVSLAGLGLGVGARRQIRRAAGTGTIRFTGRGPALAAIVCGAAGLLLTLLSLGLTALVQLS